MALRHPFPDALLEGYQLLSEPTETVPVCRKPKKIQFRNGRDLNEICEQMVGYPQVEIIAATGSGKSTGMPAALAAFTGKPVIHVVPSNKLSASLYDFVVAGNTTVPITYALETADPMGTTGVTYTCAANIVALCLRRRVANAFTDFEGGVYLYLDEFHESDGFTRVVKSIAHRMGGVVCVIRATATPDADRMPMAEMDGECDAQMFAASERPSDWDPAQPGKPWSISEMDDNALIYVDDDKVAQSLLEKYARGGVTPYRLSARMPVDAFRRIYKELTDPASGIIVLIADYSFRSGFTFPVSRIVDSGVVQYVTIENGVQVTRVRCAYRLERYQAQHRGARTKGSRCTYFSPMIDQPNAICELEGIEVELAVTLFRMLGYNPPTELAAIAFMATGNIPRDIVKAANGSVAFPLLSADETIPLVKAKAESEFSVSDVVDELVNGYQEDVPSPVVDYFSDVEFDETKVPMVTSDGLEFLQQLRSMSLDNSSLLAGRYYKVPGLPNTGVVSELYGTDWKLALEELDKKSWLISGFTRQQKLELIALLLAEYNAKVAIAAGIDKMAEAKEKLTMLSVRFPDHVFKWSDHVTSVLRESKALQAAFLKLLDQLRVPGMEFIPIMPDITLENKIADAYAKRLTDAVRGADKIVDGADYMKFIETKVPDVMPAPVVPYDKLVVESTAGDVGIRVYQEPVRVGKSRMWDLSFHIPNGLMWATGDCEDALRYYLSMNGLSARSIRSLSFIGPRVESAKVLRRVVDAGDLKHRQTLTRKFTLQELDKGGGVKDRKLIDTGDISLGKLVRFNDTKAKTVSK